MVIDHAHGVVAVSRAHHLLTGYQCTKSPEFMKIQTITIDNLKFHTSEICDNLPLAYPSA